MLRAQVVVLLMLTAASLAPRSASASIAMWLDEVAQGTPANFTITNVPIPVAVDISGLSGEITYEFIVNGADRATAGTLIGSNTNGQNQAIRFEQWQNTDSYGITVYGDNDYSFNVPTSFDVDVHLAFVSQFGVTELFINGVSTGQTLPIMLTLNGVVGFSATLLDGGVLMTDDSFAGSILGFAAYDWALTGAELKAHADAYFAADPVPEPAAWLVFGGLGLIGTLGVAVRRRLAGASDC